MTCFLSSGTNNGNTTNCPWERLSIPHTQSETTRTDTKNTSSQQQQQKTISFIISTKKEKRKRKTHIFAIASNHLTKRDAVAKAVERFVGIDGHVVELGVGRGSSSRRQEEGRGGAEMRRHKRRGEHCGARKAVVVTLNAGRVRGRERRNNARCKVSQRRTLCGSK